MTADELWRMPDDGQRHELVKGELRTMPPAGLEHGIIVLKLSRAIGNYVEAKRLGVAAGAETGFLIARDPDTVRAPDMAFVSATRVPQPLPKAFPHLAPDLAVEVLSPSDTVYEVEEKVEEWLEAGTLLVWVVNPRRRTITVHRPGRAPQVLTADGELDGEDVLPGFRQRVGGIFG
jgi:Uma2 family endonuclease